MCARLLDVSSAALLGADEDDMVVAWCLFLYGALFDIVQCCAGRYVQGTWLLCWVVNSRVQE